MEVHQFTTLLATKQVALVTQTYLFKVNVLSLIC